MSATVNLRRARKVRGEKFKETVLLAEKIRRDIRLARRDVDVARRHLEQCA